MESKPHATEIDLYVIQKVKEVRKKANMNQIDLSQHLGMADSFVSNVESNKRRDKYNIRHLNELAKVFKCSPQDFLPTKPI
jgi:transcriptional regulator with XRE-family HTH domain